MMTNQSGSGDYCYCADACDNRACFRNIMYAPIGIYTAGYLRGTELCMEADHEEDRRQR